MTIVIKKKSIITILGVLLFVFITLAFFSSGFFRVDPVTGIEKYYGSDFSQEKLGKDIYVYTLSGNITKNTRFLLGNSFNVSLSNPVTLANTDINVRIPIWRASEIKPDICQKIVLKYRQTILGLKQLSDVSVTNCTKKADLKGDSDPNLLRYDLKDFLDKSSSIYSLLQLNANGDYPRLMSCTQDGKCDKNTEYEYAPYSWVRYSQMFDNHQSGKDSADYLEELKTISADKFSWRLFQYGEAILWDKTKYSNFTESYLEVLKKNYSTEYFSIGEDLEPHFYTKSNPPQADFSTSSLDAFTSVMRSSEAVNEFAIAYELTGDNAQYKRPMDSNIEFMHTALYFDSDLLPSVTTEMKTGSCYAMLADARAFRATKDNNYLTYIQDIVQSNDIPLAYDSLYSVNTIQANNPMNILPCIDAYETVLKDLPETISSAGYIRDINVLYNYMFDNQIVDSSPRSKLYGAVYNGVRKQNNVLNEIDVNSTMWLRKLILQTTTRKFKTY